MNIPLRVLNDLSPSQFLAEYWQKKPLLIRQAIPNFKGLLSPEELAGLACEEGVESRLVQFKKNKWHCQQGPFAERDFLKLPEKDWTLLVQSVNHHLPKATQLLAQFNFIPHARLDDLMVSYAPEGGGVGPHFDSYDVFLLQGSGKRLWRVSAQTDLSLVEGAPLKILKNFETAEEWLLEVGDMLYLPPHLAHWGIAVGEGCMTYSIGFRAPKHQELASEFLGFLQDSMQQEANAMQGMYQDADLTWQAHPAQISAQMVQKVKAVLAQITWSDAQVAEFLGRYLTEPKPHIWFEQPKSLTMAQWVQRMKQHGICLDAKSQMLFMGDAFFINGEQVRVAADKVALLATLADKRTIPPSLLQAKIEQDLPFCQQLLDWTHAGYIRFGTN